MKNSKKIGDQLVPYSDDAAIDYVQRYLIAIQNFNQSQIEIKNNEQTELNLDQMIVEYGQNPLFSDVMKFDQLTIGEVLNGNFNEKPMFELKNRDYASRQQLFEIFKLKLAYLYFMNLVDYWIPMETLDISLFIKVRNWSENLSDNSINYTISSTRDSTRDNARDNPRDNSSYQNSHELTPIDQSYRAYGELFGKGYLKEIINLFDIKSDMPENERMLLKNSILEYLEIVHRFETFKVLNAKFLTNTFKEQVEYLINKTHQALSELHK